MLSLQPLKEHYCKRVLANIFKHVKRRLQRVVRQWRVETAEGAHIAAMEMAAAQAKKMLKRCKKEAKQSQESLKEVDY